MPSSPEKPLIRKSVPTEGMSRWWEAGWMYVMPDFDNPNHSIVGWMSDKMPVYPPRSEKSQTESAEYERAAWVR